MNRIFSKLALSALCVVTLNVQAQTADFVELIPTPYLQKDLTATAGLGIVTLPKYADGSKQKYLPLPVLDLEWKSGVFFSTVSGFGYNFSQNPSLQYGVRVGLIAAQEQSARNSNNGPGNTRTDIAPGVFGNYLIDQHFAVLSSLTTGAGVGAKQHDGFLASAGIRYADQINPSSRISGTLGTTWASMHYMQDYFGVTPQQGIDSKFPVYDAKAGMLKIKLTLGWTLVINKDWSLLTGGSVAHPLGAASSSPLASDKNQIVAYSALYYQF